MCSELPELFSVILYIYHVETLAFIVISPGLNVQVNVFTLPEREVSLVWPRSKWAVCGPQCKMSFNEYVLCWIAVVPFAVIINEQNGRLMCNRYFWCVCALNVI